MALKTQSYSISISSKVPYKSCIVNQKVFLWMFFMFSLQAVKRSHRRLGLAQKLMEQVLSSCCFYSCKISSCIILEHYCKLFVWKIFVHRCDIHTLSFKFLIRHMFFWNISPLLCLHINFHLYRIVNSHMPLNKSSGSWRVSLEQFCWQFTYLVFFIAGFSSYGWMFQCSVCFSSCKKKVLK